MKLNEFKAKVDARRAALDADRNRLDDFKERVGGFVEYVKSHSTVYKLIKNWSVWQELEKLIGGGTDAD